MIDILEVQHPDEFIVHQFGINEAKALPAFKAMRARLKKPAMTAGQPRKRLSPKQLRRGNPSR